MRRLSALCIALAMVGLVRAADSQESGGETAKNPVGTKIASFKLQDYRGKEVSLGDFADKPVIVVTFLGTECPLARLYAPRLQELAKQYEKKGVMFLGINSNRQDSVTELGHYARSLGVEFPLLKDPGNVVADQFGAQRTPEVFVLDKDRVVRYAGRIDDQYGIGATSGYAKTELRRRYMVDAVEALLAGKEVADSRTTTPGCLIGRVREPKADSSVTYAKQVSRIFQKHCEECHRPGQIAPFALRDYDEVVGWADMIAEVVRDQRMPPWHADPHFGQFSNDRSLSPEEKETILTWVRNGAPLGDAKDLPEPVQFSTEWQLPNPDQVVNMDDKPFPIPADGVMEYEYFLVDPQWTEDKWLEASECRIGNRGVVHHVFVFSVPPGVKVPDFNSNREARREAAREGRRFERRPDDGFNPGTGGIELIAGAAPGTPPWRYREGMASHLRAGTKLLFQMHYTPNGQETTDLTGVSFVFADPKKATNNVRMTMAINPQFVIPAGEENYPVKAAYSFAKDSMILTMAPHMHLRGKAFRYDLEYPDGTKETILNVPRYDFNWQVIYMLKEPKFVPAGTRMVCMAHFDNSANNLANPDPTANVRWGDQTWEEMMIGWFAMTDDIDPSMVDPSKSRTARFVEETSKKPARIGTLLKRTASNALESDITMDAFLRHVARTVPQVDRICVSIPDGSEVRFVKVAQSPVLDPVLGRTEKVFAKGNSALARVASGASPVVHGDLSAESAPDLKDMSQRLGSSLHIPITIDGKKGVLSFWSKEKNAFPESAQKALNEVAQLIGSGKSTAAND
ncbi:MAG: redoxin domain-containing protein [Planctomycetota bacterium]